MKGYIPEGSYQLMREIFENEAVGTSDLVNWTGESSVLMVDHPDAVPLDPHNFFNKYKALRLRHQGTAIIRARFADINDFITECSFIIQVDAANANGGEFRIKYRNDAGQVICGMGTIKVGGSLYPLFWGGTSGGWFQGSDAITEDVLHEFKCLIHNSHSNTPDRVEFLFDGHKVWWDGAAAQYVRDKTKDEEVKIISGTKFNYFELSTNGTTAGDQCYFTCFMVKEWCDMDGDYEISDAGYVQTLVQSNDKSIYYKLKDFLESIDVRSGFNESPECNFTFKPLLINQFIEDFITEEDDGEWEHVTYDNRFRVFMQQSRYIMHGWKAESLAANPDRLVDSIVDFDALGVQAGDYIWIYKQGETILNPYRVVSVINVTTLEVTPNISNGATDVTHISYHINRQLDIVESSSLGDYIFKGQVKDFNWKWSATATALAVTSTSDEYIAIQKHIWCHSSRFYRKKLEEVLTGRFRYDSTAGPPTSEADQIVTGLYVTSGGIQEGLDLGNYSGLLGLRLIDIGLPDERVFFTQAFQRNIASVSDANQVAPITKQWTPEMTLYDALVSLADTLFLQMDVYTDDEYRDERVVFLRDRPIITDSPLYNFWVGELYPATFVITETDRPIIEASLNKGSREFIDRVVMLGAADPNTGIILADDEPPNQDFDGFTRDVVKQNSNIIDLNLLRQNATYLLNELARKPEEGAIVTPNFSLLETWFNNIYNSDAAVETYYGRQSIESNGYFFGDSDWFTNLTAGGENENDRTSQGHLHRRPFSPVGEPCRLYQTSTKYIEFVINGWMMNYSSRGILVSVEPDALPFENSRYLTQVRREIEWTKQTLGAVDAAVQPCELQPIGKGFVENQRYIAVGRMPDDIILPTFVAPGAGLCSFQFAPSFYQDVLNSLSAYGYAFFVTDQAPPNDWGSWQRCRIQGQPIRFNTVVDIDNTVPDILMNNDPGGFYGFAGPNNFIYLDTNGLGFAYPAQLYFMVVLVQLHDIDGNPHTIPRIIFPGAPITGSVFIQTSIAPNYFFNGEDERHHLPFIFTGPHNVP